MKYVVYGAAKIAKKYIEQYGMSNIVAVVDSDDAKVGKDFYGKLIQNISCIRQTKFGSQLKLLVTVHDWYPVCMKMAEVIKPENILYIDDTCKICNMNGTKVKYAYENLKMNLALDIFHETILTPRVSKQKVRFFMLPIVHAYSAIRTLVEEYILDCKYDVCIIMPEGLETSIYHDDFKKLKQELIQDRIPFIDFNNYNIETDMPDICFFYMEESLKRVARYTPYCKMTVIVQHRPVLIHSTRQERIEEIFGDEGSKSVSYFICNHFMTRWLSNRFNYCEKILDFGFPKLDLLYKKTHCDAEIPLEWKRKIKNRKVFLYNWMTILGKRLEEELSFNTYEKYLNYLIEYFKDQSDLCLIIRTRETLDKQIPEYIWNRNKRNRFKEICKSCDNIILDETDTYYAAFICADALISSFSSLITYFLCMGKPCLFLHGCEGEYKNMCKEWMKLCEEARSESDINDFIKKVVSNIICDSSFKEQFDGNACKRIKNRLDYELNNNILRYGNT